MELRDPKYDVEWDPSQADKERNDFARTVIITWFIWSIFCITALIIFLNM